MKLTDKAPSKTHRVLVFGEPKSGKTELVSKLSSNFNLLWFDLENGYTTLLKLPRPQQERIELISIPDTKVFPVAIETMLKVITGNRMEICEEHGKVSCQLCKKEGKPTVAVELNTLSEATVVVVDSLTQLSNSAMNHLTKAMDDTYKPEWSDYRNQGQLLDKFLSQVQQAKFNVAIITHVTETELEDGKKKLVPVAGTTNFSRNTAKYFDHVVYCDVKNRKHCFTSSTTSSANVLTGSRTDVEIEKDEAPTLLRIFKGQVQKTVVKAADKGSVEADAAETTVAQQTGQTPAQNALARLAALRKTQGDK